MLRLSRVASAKIVVPADECYHKPRPDTQDHCMLVHLTSDAAGEYARSFAADKSTVGTFSSRSILSSGSRHLRRGVMKQCEGKKLHNLACGPHCFSISERAFVVLKKTEKSQCVVVSGESGKQDRDQPSTHELSRLPWLDARVKNELTQKIMDANPILESFGAPNDTQQELVALRACVLVRSHPTTRSSARRCAPFSASAHVSPLRAATRTPPRPLSDHPRRHLLPADGPNEAPLHVAVRLHHGRHDRRP